MSNRRDRFAALVDEFHAIAAGHPGAMEQITMAELAESVQQSNAIENSTLSLDDTEQILDGAH